MNNPFTTNEAKLKRQATEAGNAFREALAEQPAQPSKPWVGLTTEDRVEILRARGEASVLHLTEAKLKDKNGY